jgi:HlyD family secretion protein
VVAELRVKEGSHVRAGDLIARVRNEVSLAQVRQAEQSLQTARAQLQETMAGARSTELRAARARVRQSESAVREAQARVASAQATLRQSETRLPIERTEAETRVSAAEASVAAAQQRLKALVEGSRRQEIAAAEADLAQARAQAEKLESIWRRRVQLLQERAIAAEAVENARRDYQAAEASVRSTQQQLALVREGPRTEEIRVAETEVSRAEAALRDAIAYRARRRISEEEVESARAAVRQARAAVQGAQSAVAASQAELRTLEQGARPETIQVARRRVQDAETGVKLAQAQARNYLVRAPFEGTVTRVVAELGAVVGAGGIVRLIQTSAPEVLVEVDETRLSELQVGQSAVVTSETYRNVRFEARITEIAPEVDEARGTVDVTLVASKPPAWLRPGQTLNVNIITAHDIRRVVVPRSAVRSLAGSTVVLAHRNGRVEARPVVIGTVEGDQVPVLEGLREGEEYVLNAEKLEPGQAARPMSGP